MTFLLGRKVLVLGGIAVLTSAIAVTSNSYAEAPRQAGLDTSVSTRDGLRQMREQRPLVQAANLIQGQVERAGYAGFAGVEIDGSHLNLWWKGAVPPAVTSLVKDVSATAAVRVKAAAHSRAELKAAAAKVRARVAVAPGAAVHAIKLPVDGSGLVLGVSNARTAPAISTLQATVPDVGLPVTMRAEAPPAQISRNDDAPPWSGGAEIINQTEGAGCTSGFGVKDGAGRQYLLIAAHCGETGSQWTDGQGETIGYGGARNEGHDVELIPTSSVQGRIYTGGASSNSGPTVDKWEYAVVGESVCQSGMTSAEATGGPVCNLRIEIADDNGTIEAVQQNGQAGARPGDSGGPVYSDLGNGHVIAKGTSTWISGCCRFGFHPVSQASRDFGIDVVNGASNPGPGPTPGAGQITGLNGKCVDVNGSNSADGTAIQVWTCNSTAAQNWTVGSDGTVRALGKCMDVYGAGTADGTKVILWTCHGGGNQVWQSYNGGLRNPNSGKCLDIPGSNSADGNQLIIWSCHGAANQRWTLPS